MVNKFVKYVTQHRTPHESKDYNFQSLSGGKFKLTDPGKFFTLLLNYKELKQSNAFPLVFRGPRKTSSPFYLDIDLRLDTDERISDSVFFDMAQEFLTHLKKVTGAGFRPCEPVTGPLVLETNEVGEVGFPCFNNKPRWLQSTTASKN